jgi:hypothetical protein
MSIPGGGGGGGAAAAAEAEAEQETKCFINGLNYKFQKSFPRSRPAISIYHDLAELFSRACPTLAPPPPPPFPSPPTIRCSPHTMDRTYLLIPLPPLLWEQVRILS